MLKTTADGFVALDGKGRITYVNTVSERVADKERRDVLGKKYIEVCPELRDTRFHREVSAALTTHSGLDFEYFHQPIEKWFRVHATPDRDGLAVFFHDITEQKQFELEKRTIHQRSFEILEAISDAFIALDQQDRFSYVNLRAEQLWNKHRDQLLGKMIWEVFTEFVGTDFEARLRGGIEQRTRFVSSTLFGTAMEIDAHPCAGGVCIYVHDIDRLPTPDKPIDELIFAAQESERQRIARELHDSAGQVLAALGMGLRALAESSSLAAARRQAEQLQSLAHRVTKELGYLSRTLYGTDTIEVSLQSALRQLCADFASTFGIKVRVIGRPRSGPIQRSTQLTVYRIAQEALANVARHANAACVRVSMKVSPSTVNLKVVDDGCGFETTETQAEDTTHMGLRTMRDRAEFLGGTLKVHSRPGRGTCVEASIPNLSGHRTEKAA